MKYPQFISIQKQLYLYKNLYPCNVFKKERPLGYTGTYIIIYKLNRRRTSTSVEIRETVFIDTVPLFLYTLKLNEDTQ